MPSYQTIKMEEVGPCYKKPFHLFHYNKVKFPEPKRKKVGNIRGPPDIKTRTNNATRMRNKAIHEYMEHDPDPVVNYGELTKETGPLIFHPPDIIPKETKSSNFRYKWNRDIPVVACSYTEHMMMYKKPPFTYLKANARCGAFRLQCIQLEGGKGTAVEPMS